MFTSNYTKYKTGMFMGTDISLKQFDGTTAKISTGTSAPALCGDIGLYMQQAHCRALASRSSSSGSQNDCYAGIYFGSGITPPAATDYTLEVPITTGLSIVNTASVAMTHDAKRYSYCNTIELTNGVSVAISVSEIGLFGQSSSGNTRKPVLYERTVLETPIVIEPGETKVIRYWVDMYQFFGGE